MQTKKPDYDVIIIGGGPAGLSALLWCTDLGLSAALFEKRSEFGGQLLQIHNPVTNYLGLNAQNGKEVRDVFIRQLESSETRTSLSAQSSSGTRTSLSARSCVNTRLDIEITQINVNSKTVETKSGEKYSARAIVIATGVRRRKLNIEGETEFAGKGVLESGSLEKKSVTGKKVLIVGGGDAALENAVILSEYAERVYIAHRRSELTARPEFIDSAKAANNVEVIFNVNVNKILGGGQIESVELKAVDTKSKIILEADAVLIRIGVEPNSEFLSEPGESSPTAGGGVAAASADGVLGAATGFQHEKLALDPNGYILIDSHCETSAKGIYAIGDVANPISPTITTAAGGGATAAKAIFALLNSKSRV